MTHSLAHPAGTSPQTSLRASSTTFSTTSSTRSSTTSSSTSPTPSSTTTATTGTVAGSITGATESPHEPQCSPRVLTYRRLRLFSRVRGIDNILLTKELQQGLALTCQMISDPRLLTERMTGPVPSALLPPGPSRAAVQDIVLFDCRETSTLELQNLLPLLPYGVGCALFNLSRNSPHERLIEWPQIQGMFYHNSGLQHLLSGVRAMMKGELWLPRHLCQDFLCRRRAPIHPLITDLTTKLTRREREALEGLYAGKNNNALASQLKLSEHTIKSHLYSAYKKIGVKSRLEASNWLRDHYNLLDRLSSG